MQGRRVLWLAIAVTLLALMVGGLFYAYRLIEPDRRGATVAHFRVESALVGESLEQTVIAPKGGAAGRPLLVLLHGRGSGPGSYLTQPWFDALAELGERAPALLLVDGGDHSYYHDRADGRWGTYVLDEVIPLGAAELGVDGERIAIGGISMGGFGALRLGLERPGAFCAVGGHSAALWRSGGETPEGAFDDAEDFARNDVIALAGRRRRPFGDTRLWLDVGDRDPFAAADRELARVLGEQGQEPEVHVWSGDHSGSYWNEHVDEYLRFYARALAAC